MSHDRVISDQPRIARVVHVTREYRGLAGAGGIKDVAEGLAKAAAAAGIDTHVFLPHYRIIDSLTTPLNVTESDAFTIPINYPTEDRTEEVTIHTVSMEHSLTVHLVNSHRFRFLAEGDGKVKRNGIYTYTKEEATSLGRPELVGKGYYDFFAMNTLLVKATLTYLGAKNVRPDIIHCHDGHTATLPLLAQESEEGYAAFLGYTPSLITVHNAGMGYHQEIEDLEFARCVCGLHESKKVAIAGCQLQNRFDPLLAGGIFGSLINAVSENYAREVQQTGQDWMTGWLGHALAARGITLHGVTNGVDPETWNPARAEALGLDAPFSVLESDFAGKEICKQRTIEAFSRSEFPSIPADEMKRLSLMGRIECLPDLPLLTFIGRLDHQKGFDVLADALMRLFSEDDKVQLLGLGSGDPKIQAKFAALVEEFPGRVCLAVGYSDTLAAKVYAAGDFFIVPSRFEPCGLTDFFAQLMGNVPIVQSVGGLVKTVHDRFGYAYRGGDDELLEVLRLALGDYREAGKAKIRKIQRDAVINIRENFAWPEVLAKKYLPLYQMAIQRVQPVAPY